jgi:hypothetical protein
MDNPNKQTDTQGQPKLPLFICDQKPGAIYKPEECKMPELTKDERSGSSKMMQESQPNKRDEDSHTGKCKCSVL